MENRTPRRAGPRRRPIERDRDRKRAVDFALSGMTQTEIATALGVSQAMVSLDLAKARREWTAEMIGDLDAVLRDELTRLDALEAQALASFAVSATDHQPGGDPRFLAVVTQVARQRAKLLGMEKSAAITAQYTANIMQVNAGGNTDELRDRATRFANQFGMTLDEYVAVVADGVQQSETDESHATH